jgi:uncharacterized protein (DUF1015 family)
MKGGIFMGIFQRADILLPKDSNMESWAVIAVDQFVSQIAYWEEVKHLAGDGPSTLNLVLPEAYLEEDDSAAIAKINATMERYLQEEVFTRYPGSFIYVERTLQNGSIRQGIVGALDLENYDYRPGSATAIRATEQTVPERIPPRVQIRRDAPLELPHVLLLCDDSEQKLIEAAARKAQLPCLYDFELMAGGGHIRGYLLTGSDADTVDQALAAYETAAYARLGENAVLYAIGDGNHSIAAAKACYENLKKENPGKDLSCHPARYALAELENIHHAAQVFEPIHRLVKNTDPEQLLAALRPFTCDNGQPVQWMAGNKSGTVRMDCSDGQLPVGILQHFLDAYKKDAPQDVDYIHGEKDLQELSCKENTVGFLLPAIDKNAFFAGIVAGGTLPRKTFSMGHAREKRYYLEARKIR